MSSNPCGTPAGTTTMSPAATGRRSPPANVPPLLGPSARRTNSGSGGALRYVSGPPPHRAPPRDGPTTPAGERAPAARSDGEADEFRLGRIRPLVLDATAGH